MLDSMEKAESKASILDLELADIIGIGPTRAKKLKDAGYNSIFELPVASADELALDTDIDKATAAAYIIASHKLLRESRFIDSEFTTGLVAFGMRNSVRRCSTSSNALDKMLYGGIETRAITEFFGEFGSGKSHICHALCVNAIQPAPVGFGANSIWIDRENTFRPERIEQITKARSLNSDEVLKSISVAKVYNSSHLELVVKELGKNIEQFKAKLVVFDSIIALHRAEFAGRGTLAERQQWLNALMHKLIRIAEIYDVAVVITNQVQSTPGTFFGDPLRPAGGNVIGHAATYRIYLRKAGTERVARIIDSPYHPYTSEGVRFTINEKGVDDVIVEKKKSKVLHEKSAEA